MGQVGEIVATVRDAAVAELEATGFVVIDDVPAAEVQAVLRMFGEIVPFLGSWKYDVEVRDEVATLYTARSFGALHPHLDKYEWMKPPDVVALFGRRADRSGLGQTHVCDMAPFIESLGPEDLHRLRSVPMSYIADAGLRAVGIDDQYKGPAFDEADPARPRFRFSYNYAALPTDDPGFADLWERTRAWYEEHKQSVLLVEDRLLVWRNALVLHSRDSFTDPDRFLWRVYLREVGL